MREFEIIGPCKAKYYINNPYAVFIDLRDEEEYFKNHVNGAFNVTISDMQKFIQGRAKLPELYNIFDSKEKIYIFYCEHGSSSIRIADLMSKKGYIAKSVLGGYEKIKNTSNF